MTAVQLSRGKAEAQLLFEITLLMQDLGRLAADVLLFYTQEFGFLELPDAFTTGSSIMPQKRNPDVFELIRGRTATAQACLDRGARPLRQAALGLPARPAAAEVPAVPRHRPGAADARHPPRRASMRMRFRPERIRLDPAIHAAEEANRLVVDGRHPVPRSLSPRRREAEETAVAPRPRRRGQCASSQFAPGADIDPQRHAQLRGGSHPFPDGCQSPRSTASARTSSTSSSCTCMMRRAGSVLARAPGIDGDHRALDDVGRGALHRRVDGAALRVLPQSARCRSGCPAGTAAGRTPSRHSRARAPACASRP